MTAAGYPQARSAAVTPISGRALGQPGAKGCRTCEGSFFRRALRRLHEMRPAWPCKGSGPLGGVYGRKGQKIGVSITVTIPSKRFKGTPMRRKSVNRYPPGP